MPPPPNPIHPTPATTHQGPLEEVITLDLDLDPTQATATIQPEREVTMEEVMADILNENQRRKTSRNMTLDEAIQAITDQRNLGVEGDEDEEDEEEEENSINVTVIDSEIPQYPQEFVSEAVAQELDRSLADFESKVPKRKEAEPKSAEELHEEELKKLSAHWITGHTQIEKARVIDAKKKEEKEKAEERQRIRLENKVKKELALKVKKEEQERKALEREEKKKIKEEQKKAKELAKAQAGPSKRKRKQEVVPSLDAAVKRVTRRTRQRPAGPTVRCTSFYTFSNRIPSHKFVLPNASDRHPCYSYESRSLALGKTRRRKKMQQEML